MKLKFYIILQIVFSCALFFFLISPFKNNELNGSYVTRKYTFYDVDKFFEESSKIRINNGEFNQAFFYMNSNDNSYLHAGFSGDISYDALTHLYEIRALGVLLDKNNININNSNSRHVELLTYLYQPYNVTLEIIKNTDKYILYKTNIGGYSLSAKM